MTLSSPASRHANRVARADVTDQPLDVTQHERLVADPGAGAVVSFAGVVRDHDHGRQVRALSYEAHPTAQTRLRGIAAEVAADPAVYAVAVSHRVGDLQIGDVAFAVAVSSAHRAAAFDACRRLVDDVKANVPIWKHQLFTDGTTEWVNCP